MTDDELNRFRWLHNSFDNGAQFFKNYHLNESSNDKDSIQKLIKSLNVKIEELAKNPDILNRKQIGKQFTISKVYIDQIKNEKEAHIKTGDYGLSINTKKGKVSLLKKMKINNDLIWVQESYNHNQSGNIFKSIRLSDKCIEEEKEKLHKYNANEKEIIDHLRNLTDEGLCIPNGCQLQDFDFEKSNSNNLIQYDNHCISFKNIELENKLESVREKKNSVVKNQKYEEAAKLRDDEKKLEKELLTQQEQWETELKKKREIVTDINITEVVSLISGIPLKKIDNTTNEKNTQFDLESKLKESIIGQNDAIDVVVNAIQRNQTGLKDPNKPIGSFIFLGQTGVGKTQLAKSLGEELFNSKDSLIRLDMSEYMEKFSVSRLIGAPPGYVGYEEGGQLSEKVRRKPYSIVLLDEVEKAHPDVFNMMLQVLDDGYLTDSVGRKVDFKNTVIIMTSNIGTRKLKDFGTGVGFDTDYRKKEKNKLSTEVLKKSLGKKFSPEFLNRIDEIVVFNELDKNEIEKIVKIEIKKFINRLSEIEYKIQIDIDPIGEKFSHAEVTEFSNVLKLHSDKKPLQIRDYQKDAIHEAVNTGRTLLLSPTASGKSLLSTSSDNIDETILKLTKKKINYTFCEKQKRNKEIRIWLDDTDHTPMGIIVKKTRG